MPHGFPPTLSYRHDQETKAGGVVFKTVLLLSADRGYRNKTVYATHLAEFHQIGQVIEDNLTLENLIRFMVVFFEMGLPNITFKHASTNTEPSVEIFSRYPNLEK
ncbi:MAG: hypothetical protein J3Q66DRAFT_305147, partial [Benniella sp.]